MPRLPFHLLLPLALLATGCGGAEQTPKERTRAALGEIFLLASLADAERLAPYVVYGGDDPARVWSDTADVSNRDERIHVDRLAARITALLGTQRPRFLTWSTETAPEGVWLRWKVQGANGSAWFSCLEIDGAIALADVEPD